MKHQSISCWLSQLGLPEYCMVFEQEYDGVEDILHLSEYDLLELGVHNHLHRLHLLTSLRLLQERERRREWRMMAEGRFASLPRTLHAHHTLGRGSTHTGVPGPSLATPSSGICSSRRLQASLTTSMDLLGAKPGFPPGSGMPEIPPAAYQPVSIHGTLPRRKRGAGNSSTHGSFTWDPKANQASLCRNPSLPSGHMHQPTTSSLAPHIPEDFHSYRDPAAALDAAVDYVKFSRDQFILDCSSEKLRRELEQELKMNCEEPRSHAWYHGAIPRQVAENLVQRDGDFLVRDSLSSPGNYVLTCQWRNAPQHFKVNKKVVMLNEAYSKVEYRLDKDGFDSVPSLIRFYVGNRKPVSQVVGAIIFQPINRSLPLRYLEEKYALSGNQREAGLVAQEKPCQKRLSLNITNGIGHAVHDGSHCPDNGLSRSSHLRLKDRCGSQPASLNQVQDRRRPLKAHQSDSFLPLGSKPQSQQSPDSLLASPKSPVFRTGSEPALSPCVPRRLAEHQAAPGPPVPPPKPRKLQRTLPESIQPVGQESTGRAEHLQPILPCSSDGQSNFQNSTTDLNPEHPPSVSSYVERLKREGDRSRGEDHEEKEEGGGSSHHPDIAPSEHSSEEEEDRERDLPKRGKGRSGSWRPVEETESMFRPTDFESRLLPPENKPLEMVVLKKAKELVLSHDHRSIARHLLMADCQVARILGVTAEIKGQMGVSSGLELVTLPHGRQLRLDLMERHHTMAIGVAVDILGCTGSVEERASTLNRIILVAQELKDEVGDLFAFTAMMKALDFQQISRLEETWTTLRRNFTQAAISYEKILKPFYKCLYEGTAPSSKALCLPMLLPLLTLMERPLITPEGAEFWETSDEGCDIMLRHLEAARIVAENAQSYTSNAQKILKGFELDEGLLEVFKTDFQLRLLWGSRGATVNQSDRYNKFNLILTALSRKLEPPPITQPLI
uniref:BCAR3 adaptor protein, NSP family member n=1 Tax=Oryzias melastigma TaxID=30732 RepID=A0A3B3BZQ7_ORYME